jgi:arylsulfatase A-like enzyme
MPHDGERPNIIVVLTDQQRWDTVGLHGNPLDLTPNFDRMAQRGTHVVNAFTPQPVCGPARACLQTGRYATATGCFRNDIPLPSDMRTLAHHFRDADYDTGYIGKWHLAMEEPVPESKRGGYEDWLGADKLELLSEPYQTILYDNHLQPVRLPGYRVDALTDAAIRYLHGHQERPFFLFLSHIEPHQQNRLEAYVAPIGYRERYAGRWIPPDLAALGGSTHQHIADYYGMAKRLDEALGRLLDALESLALVDRTIVVFTSDHGCHFKTRNQYGDGHKRSCHEASIRVPMAFHGPGFDSGGQIRQLVSLIDLPPTLLHAAGLPVPDEMQGRSILPLVQGKTMGWPDDVFIQISEAQVGRAVRTRRWKYGVVAPGKDGRQEAAATHYVEDCLYDLEADPYELTNLIGFHSHQEVAATLRERLIRRMTAAGEAAPTIEPAPTRPSRFRQVLAEEVGG